MSAVDAFFIVTMVRGGGRGIVVVSFEVDLTKDPAVLLSDADASH